MALAERVCTDSRGTPQEGIPAKLSPASRLLLMLLEEYCGFGSARKEFCWPSIGTLASRMGCSKRYVSKLLQRLIRDGYVASEARHRNDGSRTSNRYWLLETPIVAPGPRDNGDAPTSQVRETATNPSQPIEYPLREMNPCRWTENPESSDHLPAVLHDAELLQSSRQSYGNTVFYRKISISDRKDPVDDGHDSGRRRVTVPEAETDRDSTPGNQVQVDRTIDLLENIANLPTSQAIRLPLRSQRRQKPPVQLHAFPGKPPGCCG